MVKLTSFLFYWLVFSLSIFYIICQKLKLVVKNELKLKTSLKVTEQGSSCIGVKEMEAFWDSL